MAKHSSDEFDIDMDGLRKALTSDKNIEDSLKLLSSSSSNVYDEFIEISNYVCLCSEATPHNVVSDSGVDEEERPEKETNKSQLASIYSYSWHGKNTNKEGVIGTFHLPEQSSPKGFLDDLEDEEFYDSTESPSLFFPRPVDVKHEQRKFKHSSNIERYSGDQDSHVLPSTSKVILTEVQDLEHVPKVSHSKIFDFPTKERNINDLSKSSYQSQPNAANSDIFNISLSSNTAETSFTESNSDNESFHTVADFEDSASLHSPNTNKHDTTQPLDLSNTSREDVLPRKSLYAQTSIEKRTEEDFSEMPELEPIDATQTAHLKETKVDNESEPVNGSLASVHSSSRTNAPILLPCRTMIEKTDKEANRDFLHMPEVELIDTPILLHRLLESNTNNKSSECKIGTNTNKKTKDVYISNKAIIDAALKKENFSSMLELRPINVPVFFQHEQTITTANKKNQSQAINSHNNSNNSSNSTNEENETDTPLDLSKGSDELVSSIEANSDDEDFIDMPELEPIPSTSFVTSGAQMEEHISHVSSAGASSGEDFSDMPELEPISSSSSAISGTHMGASTSYVSSTDVNSEEYSSDLPELEPTDVPITFGSCSRYQQPSTSSESDTMTNLEAKDFGVLSGLERTGIPNLLSAATFVANTNTNLKEKFISLPNIDPAAVPILMGYLHTAQQQLPESFHREESGYSEEQCAHIQAKSLETTNADCTVEGVNVGDLAKLEFAGSKPCMQAAVTISADSEEAFADLPELEPTDVRHTFDIPVHQSPEGYVRNSGALTVTEVKSLVSSDKVEESCSTTSLESTTKEELIDLSITSNDNNPVESCKTEQTDPQQVSSFQEAVRWHKSDNFLEALENKEKSAEEGSETPKTLTPPPFPDAEDEIGLLGKYSPSRAIDADTDTETLIASGNNSEDDDVSDSKCRKFYSSRKVNKKTAVLGKQSINSASSGEIVLSNIEQKENESSKPSEDSSNDEFKKIIPTKTDLQTEKVEEAPTVPVVTKPTTPKRSPLFLNLSSLQKASKRSPDVWHDKIKEEEESSMKSPKIQRTKSETSPFDDFNRSSPKELDFSGTPSTDKENSVLVKIKNCDELPTSSNSVLSLTEDKTLVIDSIKSIHVHTATPHPKKGAKRSLGLELYASNTQAIHEVSSARKIDKRRNNTEEDSNDESDDVKELENINTAKDILPSPLPSKQSKRPDTPSPSKPQDPNEAPDEGFVKPTTRYLGKGRNLFKKRNS